MVLLFAVCLLWASVIQKNEMENPGNKQLPQFINYIPSFTAGRGLPWSCLCCIGDPLWTAVIPLSCVSMLCLAPSHQSLHCQFPSVCVPKFKSSVAGNCIPAYCYKYTILVANSSYITYKLNFIKEAVCKKNHRIYQGQFCTPTGVLEWTPEEKAGIV